MLVPMNQVIEATSEPHGTSISVELVKASIAYMRTPTPELEVPSAGQTWILDSSSAKPWFLHESSSPVLSCPPSWLEKGSQHDSLGRGTVDYADDDDVPLEVPFSSSPPDATSSSPQSAGSHSSEDLAASLTPGNLADLVSPAQDQLSLLNIPAEDTGSDFGHRLHHLLLVALKEKEGALETCETDSFSTTESSDYDSSTFSSSGYAWTSGQQSRQEGVSEFEESSPSRFVVVGLDKRRFASKHDPNLTFRLIKRAQSYVVPEECNEPVLKRQKLARNPSLVTKPRIYAHRTASLRRADSLKAVAENVPVQRDWVPTVPATPIATTPKPPNGYNGANSFQGSNALMSPVPIIAPPEDHMPKFPLSAETLAKMRLMRYLEREASGREIDGLPAGLCQRPPPWMVKANIAEGISLGHENTWDDNVVAEWEIVLGVGRKKREAAINWLLDVLPIKAPGRAPSPEKLSSYTTSHGSYPSGSYSSGSYYSSSSSSSQYTTDSPGASTGSLRPIYNLQDQLENSPETRFHAVWMFLRYFYLTMAPIPESNSKNSPIQMSRTVSRTSSLDQEGLGLVVWDIAVACLAISVKFHRDFLRPLHPVFADEYVNLAPHAISLEDLESAHRDILSVFDYRLGITPQPVMDELWAALPSLRSLLDFKGGWKSATAEAWTRLFAVLDEPDIQRFLVSVLTVVALMEGIVESVVDNFCHKRRMQQSRSASTVAEHYIKNQLLRKKLTMEAKDEAEGVFCDIQALTGITDADIRECRLWMTGRN